MSATVQVQDDVVTAKKSPRGGVEIDEGSFEEDKPVYTKEEEEPKFQIPTTNRKCTDLLCFSIAIVITIVWLILTTYCIYNGDLDRIVHGYDNCGNICGRNNAENDILTTCTVRDYTNQTFVLIREQNDVLSGYWMDTHGICVESCPPNTRQIHFWCIAKEEENNKSTLDKRKNESSGHVMEQSLGFTEKFSADMITCWNEFVLMCIILLCLTTSVLFIFRFCSHCFVWIAVAVSILGAISFTISGWFSYAKHRRTGILGLAIFLTILTVILILVIFAVRNSLRLVMALYREAGQAIKAMPCLIMIPFLTVLAILSFLGVHLYFLVWIQSAGSFETISGSENETRVVLARNQIMTISFWCNELMVVFFWTLCINCQNMVVAGAVCQWYFTRDKRKLKRPILRSFRNLTRYHLGSTVFGTFVLFFVLISRAIIQKVENRMRMSVSVSFAQCVLCFQSCLEHLLKMVEYLTRNAYIEIALYGYHFWSAGKRVFHLVIDNIVKVTVLVYVSTFILWLAVFVVVGGTVGFGILLLKEKEGLHYKWVILLLGAVLAFLISYCTMNSYDVLLDAVFVCFCEDCAINDGQAKPFFMSENLIICLAKVAGQKPATDLESMDTL